MSVILIPTFVDDIHAYAVAVALERTGHRPVLWHCSDLPERESASVRLGGSAPLQLTLHGQEADVALADIDVFWHRRIGAPVLTTPLVDCDRTIAVRESERFVRSLLSALSRDRYAVNAFESARSAEDKVLQLATAQRIGFELPATLVSGDPAQIRGFVAAHEERGVVVKNFSPMGWQGDGRYALNFTAKITSAMLPRDAMLRLTPSIWQAYVPKAHEVRVTCMGAQMTAAALHSQASDASRIDWRGVAAQTLDLRPVALPEAVAWRCAAYMRALDLRFGCFDFIVTPDGRWVFLEMNQMGQFLWVEQANPEFALLQMFCDFLVAKDPAFRWAPRGEPLRYTDVYDEACARMERAAQRHLHPPIPANVYVEKVG